MSPCVPPEDAPTLAERQPHLLWAQSFHTRHKALPHPALQRQQKCTVWPLLEAGGSNPKGFQRIIERGVRLGWAPIPRVLMRRGPWDSWTPEKGPYEGSARMDHTI